MKLVLLNRIFAALLFIIFSISLVPCTSVRAAVPAEVTMELVNEIPVFYGMSIIKNVVEFVTRIVEIASFLVNAVITIIDFLPRLMHLFLPFFPLILCRVISYFIYFLLIKGLISIIRG